MSESTVQMLGGFRLIRPDGTTEAISQTLPATLLAVLLLDAGRLIAREELLEMLWPDEDPEATRPRLRQILHGARKLLTDLGLPTDAIAADSATIQLHAGSIQTDVAEFKSLLAQADSCRNASEKVALLERADDLYSGELLPGIYLDVIVARRAAAAESHKDGLLALCHACEETGGWECALRAARKLVSLDPLMEEAHCALMRVYAAMGQPGAAVRQYQEMERVLREELGVDPSASARQLMELIRGATRVPEIRARVTKAAAGDRKLTIQVDTRAGKRRFRALVFGTVILVANILGGYTWFKTRHRAAKGKQAYRGTATSLPTSEPLWVHRYQSTSGDKGSMGTAITTDSEGNSYVAGFVDTEKFDNDYLIYKLDRSGTKVWEYRYNNRPINDVDRARCIALDSKGNVYVTGDSENGKGNNSTHLSGEDFCTIKLGPDGRPSPTWPDIGFGKGVRRYNGPDDGEEMPKKLLVDESGGVYVMGYSYSLNGGKDYAVVKYDSSGREVWALRYDSPDHDDDMPNDMCLTEDGGFCVTGSSRLRPKDAPEGDILTIKYRQSDGKPLWMHRWGKGNNFSDVGVSVFADRWQIIVAGIGRTVPATYSHTRPGFVTLVYDPSGKLLIARGAESEGDHLDRVDVAWGFGAAGETADELKVVRRGGGFSSRTTDYRAKGEEGGFKASAGGFTRYLTGWLPGETGMDYFTIALGPETQPAKEWIYRGSGEPGRRNCANAIAVCRIARDVSHGQDYVYVTGQGTGGPTRDLVTLCYMGFGIYNPELLKVAH